MSNIFSSLTGGTTINPTNPFTPFPITTASGAFGDLSSIGLDPTQQALVDFFGGEQDVRTRDIYSRLGLGGSTMEAQDLGGNELARLAESANLISSNRGQAIQEQGTLGNLIQAEQQLGTNAALQTQGQQITANQNAFNQGQTSLTNLSKIIGAFA